MAKPRCTCPRNHFVPNVRCPVHGKAAKAMLKKRTIAEKIAAELGNDGTRWKTANGTKYDDLIWRFRCSSERNDANVWRHIFGDGSAIVERGDGGGWDIEGKTPFSWRGLE